MNTPTQAELKEGLKNYLEGYTRGAPEKLHEVIAFQGWQHKAREEYERRITQLLNVLDTDTLLALATGWINIYDTAERLLPLHIEIDDAHEPDEGQRDARLNEIASRHFRVSTLEVRGNGSLDYSTQSVTALREALQEAYHAGWFARTA